MKILVVPSWYPPYGGRFFRLQAEALAEKGHQVDVLILNDKGITQKINPKINDSDSKLLNEMRTTYHRVPKLEYLNIKLYIKKYKKLFIEYLENNSPDVIHIHSTIWAGVVVSKIAKERNIPYVISEHRSVFLGEGMKFQNSLKNKIKDAFQLASKVIVVSKAMKNAISSYSEENKIIRIPNMLESNFFKILKEVQKEEVFTFLTVGNLIEVKGIDVLINSFTQLKKSNSKIQLKIIGEGAVKKELQNLVNRLGVQNDVYFEGYKTKEELVVEYNKANVFVSSSIKETFGVVLIEAMSCGLPIVVTKSGGPEDIVTEENGCLADVNNASSLQFQMQKMLDNYSNFDAEKIRQNVIEKYSKEVVVNQIEKVLEICLQHKKQ